MDVLARTIFREISLQDEFRMDILYCNNKGPLLLAWISNYMPSKVWDEITSIPKLQRCNRWSLGMDKHFHATHYTVCNYLSMLGLKLNHV